MTPSANVRRAISATLDRINAETRRDEAAEEYRVRQELEKTAVAAVSDLELWDYRVGISNALSDQQEARQLAH